MYIIAYLTLSGICIFISGIVLLLGVSKLGKGSLDINYPGKINSVMDPCRFCHILSLSDTLVNVNWFPVVICDFVNYHIINIDVTDLHKYSSKTAKNIYFNRKLVDSFKRTNVLFLNLFYFLNDVKDAYKLWQSDRKKHLGALSVI
jgi:hypothetical protein